MIFYQAFLLVDTDGSRIYTLILYMRRNYLKCRREGGKFAATWISRNSQSAPISYESDACLMTDFHNFHLHLYSLIILGAKFP